MIQSPHLDHGVGNLSTDGATIAIDAKFIVHHLILPSWP